MYRPLINLVRLLRPNYPCSMLISVASVCRSIKPTLLTAGNTFLRSSVPTPATWAIFGSGPIRSSRSLIRFWRSTIYLMIFATSPWPKVHCNLKPFRGLEPLVTGSLCPARPVRWDSKSGGGVDERFNVLKATEAACKYLRTLYTQLGSWSLVAAAYNAGPGYMKNQLKRDDRRDYYQMKLPRETRYYLYRVLLYKEIMSRPDDYSSFLSPVQQTAYYPFPLFNSERFS